MGAAIALRGTALHRGGSATVRLSASPGPTAIAQRGATAELGSLRVERADRGVTVASADGRVRLDLVEHLFAALGGLGVREGVRIACDDGELPLLDGGARRFAEAIRALAVPARAPRLRIAREATIERGTSAYRFSPGPSIHLAVDVDFRAPVGRERAVWDGDAGDFFDRIAPARTFGWADEYEALRASGRAAGVDLDSVLVLDDRGAVGGCRPAGELEVARHKLLDLIGDLALYGGPPRGTIEAVRPGHAATHAVAAEAIASGILICEEAP
jgi:UDP-3-O-[3-hydroxymyristoyl] N-acetylglucosamine deacetylase